jgi:hypothetical protein
VPPAVGSFMTPTVSLIQSLIDTISTVGQTITNIIPVWGWLGLVICFAIWLLYDF